MLLPPPPSPHGEHRTRRPPPSSEQPTVLRATPSPLPPGSEGKEMEDEDTDLNEPSRGHQGGGLKYVLLQMDSKDICRTRACDIPIEVPLVWSVIKFVRSKSCQLSKFSKFSLLPDPEDDRQNYEWGRFLRFLRDNRRVAIVKSGSFTFHIVVPQSHGFPKFSHVVAMYDTKQNDLGDCKQMAGIAEGHVNNAISKLHRLVPESSPCESVEDSPRVLDPEVKKRTTNKKNFVSTDPSYLRTLSQTHAGWIFGAIAELIDNSRDASASRLNISVEFMFSKKAEKRVPVLSVTDDGDGMSYDEMLRMISFGHKRPNGHDQHQIGRFGIGFKTGAMKLGKDVVVLTQTLTSRSVAFLSESFNENKDNLEIPVVAYSKQGQYMEVDLTVQSKASAEYNLNAIKEFSPFNEYFIGEKLGLFGEEGTGTQIYIWNLDRWGTDYTLDWNSGKPSENPVHHGCGDILIRSRRIRSRPGQISNKVPLDYSLQSYLEVMFLNPRMKISVQGSCVKSRPLAKSLNKTSVLSGEIMGKTVQLTLGRSKIEWDRMNCGIFLYWHGRLIESYKRVGGQKHSADMGRGVIGVADITDLIDDEDGTSWVLNSKQGFQDCEIYAKLEEWLGRKADEYWDSNFDNLELRIAGGNYRPDNEWVQCYSCRKWRKLNAGFNTDSLPDEWFCYMPPFNGKCELPEQQMRRDAIVIGEKRSGYDGRDRVAQQETTKVNMNKMRSNNNKIERCNQDEDIKAIPTIANKQTKSSNGAPSVHMNNNEDDFEGESSQTEAGSPRPDLRRLRRGPARSAKHKQ